MKRGITRGGLIFATVWLAVFAVTFLIWAIYLGNVNRRLAEYESIQPKHEAERIFNADKCAIIIGMAELENFDTPYIVAIDQAVGLSNKYSTEKSANFVNGILASYYNRIKG